MKLERLKSRCFPVNLFWSIRETLNLGFQKISVIMHSVAPVFCWEVENLFSYWTSALKGWFIWNSIQSNQGEFRESIHPFESSFDCSYDYCYASWHLDELKNLAPESMLSICKEEPENNCKSDVEFLINIESKSSRAKKYAGLRTTKLAFNKGIRILEKG